MTTRIVDVFGNAEASALADRLVAALELRDHETFSAVAYGPDSAVVSVVAVASGPKAEALARVVAAWNEGVWHAPGDEGAEEEP